MKETIKIQYFVDIFSKQTNQTFFFSYFNYYQLKMIFPENGRRRGRVERERGD